MVCLGKGLGIGGPTNRLVQRFDAQYCCLKIAARRSGLVCKCRNLKLGLRLAMTNIVLAVPVLNGRIRSSTSISPRDCSPGSVSIGALLFSDNKHTASWKNQMVIIWNKSCLQLPSMTQTSPANSIILHSHGNFRILGQSVPTTLVHTTVLHHSQNMLFWTIENCHVFERIVAQNQHIRLESHLDLSN